MATAVPQQRIDIGNVISMGFRAFGRNFLPLLGFTALLVGLPCFLARYFTTGGRPLVEDVDLYALSSLTSTLVYWIMSYILQGVIAAIVVRDLGGRRGEIAESATAALGRSMAMIGLAIVSGVGIILGMMLLIVPGIILTLMWMVAVPVLVEERRGVFDSLGRSAELARGSKGWIFLLLLLYWGATWMLGGAALAVTGFQLAYLETGPMLVPMAVETLTEMMSALLMGVLMAALYVELRHHKEGSAPDRLASIFE